MALAAQTRTRTNIGKLEIPDPEANSDTKFQSDPAANAKPSLR